METLKRRVEAAEERAARRDSFEREFRAMILYVKTKMPWARAEVLNLLQRLDTLDEDVEVSDRWVWAVLNEFAKAQEAKKKAETLPSIGGVHGVTQVEEAEPEEGSGRDGDDVAPGPGGGMETQPQDEESKGDMSPSLPDEEAPQLPPWVTAPCLLCGGPVIFSVELGEWICASCSSPARLLWKRRPKTM